MKIRTTLDGRPLPIEIAPGGYSLQAPGLRGILTEMTPTESATRADGGTHEPQLLTALHGAEIQSIKVFEIEGAMVDASAPAEPTRSFSGVTTQNGEPAIVLRVPALGDDVEQVVLYSDEAGVTRWVFPQSISAAVGAPARGGSGSEVEFLLPRGSAALPPQVDLVPQTRGPLTKLGRRLVRLLAWGTEDIVGRGVLAVAANWEEKHRPYGLRRVPFGDTRPVSWEEICHGRALLLIHGTFSTAQSAFALLPCTTVEALVARYGGRVYAFDHPTLHHSPKENLQRFLDMIPPAAELELDIVTHSRGGLVGREFTERLSESASGGRKVRINRAIFVAAPHRGTILTDSDHGIEMLDRYTNLFTELPDNAFTIAMEGLFLAAKLLYHGAATGLPGLRSMYPAGDYLARLNAGATHRTEYRALAADFKPTGKSLLARFGWGAADALVDGVFGEPNDGVVPTRGSYALKSAVSGFPISPALRVEFTKDDGIHHCNYFGSPRVNEKLLAWLDAA